MATLEQDYTVVPGQVFACLSVVGPECPQKTDKFGIKIRGCFATNAEAAAHAKRLQKEDATFDIYVVDMYKWLLIPPDPDKIEDTHYNDNQLEEMMSSYRENQAMGKKLFEERKRDAMAKPIPGAEEGAFSKPGDENSQFYTKPDEPPISHPAEILKELQVEFPDKPIEELIKLAEAKVQEEIDAVKARREREAIEARKGSVLKSLQKEFPDKSPEELSELVGTKIQEEDDEEERMVVERKVQIRLEDAKSALISAEAEVAAAAADIKDDGGSKSD
tara:strand:+ start:1986 stop:2813 length:828 start_codon:yes stop_codon:yes gene_type:complete